MNHATELSILEQQEARALAQIDQIRSQRKEIIDRIRLESRDRLLSQKQVAEICDYHYNHVPRLDIPFKKRRISYVKLLEFFEDYQPARIPKIQRNFNQMYGI